MGASIGALLLELLRVWRQPAPSSIQRPYPRLRNAVLDVMVEGRRKHIINLICEFDITLLLQRLARCNTGREERISLTACITYVLVRAVDEDRAMQAYRQGRSRMVLFDEVDVAMMVEREVEGHVMPVAHIIRKANRKGVEAINQELRSAKAGKGAQGTLSEIERRFFAMPTLLRRPLWWFLRRNPFLFKRLAGTVGITSMGMHNQGPAVVLPITPMTLTLSIGSIGTRVMLDQGEPVEREILWLNLGADHDLVDGAPLMRFAERFKVLLQEHDPAVS